MKKQETEPVIISGTSFPSPGASEKIMASPAMAREMKPDLGITMAPKIIPANRGLIVRGARCGSLADYGTHREASLTIYTDDHPYGLMGTVATYQTAADIVRLVAATSDRCALIAAGYFCTEPVTGNSGEEYRVLIGRIALSDVERIAMPTDVDWLLLTRCVASISQEPRMIAFPYPFEHTISGLIEILIKIVGRKKVLDDGYRNIGTTLWVAENKQVVQNIGKRLNTLAGISAMQAVFETVREAIATGTIKIERTPAGEPDFSILSEIERAWDGIGEWCP